MQSIIKIADLELLCIPKFTVTKKKAKKEKNMITRIELENDERVHFVNNHKKLQFHRMQELGIGFEVGNRIRYFKHDIDPKNRFYMQAVDINDFENLNINDQKQFYSISQAKNSLCCTGTGVIDAMGIDAFSHPGSFDSDKLAQVLSDDGWLMEVDITGYIETL